GEITSSHHQVGPLQINSRTLDSNSTLNSTPEDPFLSHKRTKLSHEVRSHLTSTPTLVLPRAHLLSTHTHASLYVQLLPSHSFWTEIWLFALPGLSFWSISPGHLTGLTGLLHPLLVLSERWLSVTMGFITELPECKGFNSIMVVVDRFTKMAHFVPCQTNITAQETARLYVDRVFRHHGIPTHIISDQDTVFASEFWGKFCEELGVQPIMSTAYHPEMDGQTERDNWVDLLVTAEFSYNNSHHSATSVSPFFANYGPAETDLSWSLFWHSLCLDVETRSRQGGIPGTNPSQAPRVEREETKDVEIVAKACHMTTRVGQ
ncbi:retrotransposable element protein, partial [Planoprotostelium fungivorum]